MFGSLYSVRSRLYLANAWECWCSALGSAPIYFVLFFCSFLLLGRAPRASRPTGRSCSCVLRPPRSSDKILSSWKPRSQESVIFSLRRGLGRDNQPTPCVMGFSCERDSHSEPCLGPGESPLDEGVSHAEDGPAGAAESSCTWERAGISPSCLVFVGGSRSALCVCARQLVGGHVVVVIDHYRQSCCSARRGLLLQHFRRPTRIVIGV